MDNTPRQILKELVATHGPALTDNPQRCKGMLLDRCQDQKLEVNLLTQALEEQVPADLRQISTGTPYPILQARLVKRLHDNKGIAEEYARWAIDSWALALGVVIQTEPAAPKTQPPLQEKQAIPETPGLTATQVPTALIAPTQIAAQGNPHPSSSPNQSRAGLIYGVVLGILALIAAPVLYNLYVQTQAYALIGFLQVCTFAIFSILAGVLPSRASGSVKSAAMAGGLLGLGTCLGSIIGDSTDLIQGGVWIGVVVVFGGGILIISLVFGLLGRYLYRRSHVSS